MKRLLAAFGITTDIPPWKERIICALYSACFGSMTALAVIPDGPSSLPDIKLFGTIAVVSVIALAYAIERDAK